MNKELGDWRRLFLVVGVLAAAAPSAARAEDDLVVFAAASLRETFEHLIPAFEKSHAGTKVRLNLAGSQELRLQIEQGARADVFAAADTKNMLTLVMAGFAKAPLTFARNEPVVVVPKQNPAKIRAFAELGRAKRLVIGAPEVPIGAYTVKVLDAATKSLGAAFRSQVDAAVVSRELNVKQVLAKVTLGEADAGIVYRTDALAAKDKVEVVAIPAELNVTAEYPIAVVAATKLPVLARAWVDFVLSPEGQSGLVDAGFLSAKPLAAKTQAAKARTR